MKAVRVRTPRRIELRWVARLVGVGLLGLISLFLLQFALQAAFNSPLQGLLALVATAAFAVAANRLFRQQAIAGLLFASTLPLFLFSLAATFLYSDESPIYAAVSAVPPLVAGWIWLVERR